MYELKDYLLNIKFGVGLGTLWVLGAMLAKFIAVKMDISTTRRKVAFSFIISIIYIIVCLPTGIPFFSSDTIGFCWFHAMFGFAIGIFPACMIALFSKKKTVQIACIVGSYVLAIAYMISQLLLAYL